MAQCRTINGHLGQHHPPPLKSIRSSPLPPSQHLHTGIKEKHTSGTGLATCAEAALVVTDLLAARLGEAKARMGAALVRRAARENMVVAGVAGSASVSTRQKIKKTCPATVVAEEGDGPRDEGRGVERERWSGCCCRVVGTRVCSGRSPAIDGFWNDTQRTLGPLTFFFGWMGSLEQKNGGPRSVGAAC